MRMLIILLFEAFFYFKEMNEPQKKIISFDHFYKSIAKLKGRLYILLFDVEQPIDPLL